MPQGDTFITSVLMGTIRLSRSMASPGVSRGVPLACEPLAFQPPKLPLKGRAQKNVVPTSSDHFCDNMMPATSCPNTGLNPDATNPGRMIGWRPMRTRRSVFGTCQSTYE